MENKPSGDLITVPKIIYGPEVNKTTPYIVGINPSVYAELLRGGFGMSDAQVSSVEVAILADLRASKTRGILGETTHRFDVRRLRWGHTATIFMGTFWNSPRSPQYAWFFNRAARWEQTRQRITRTIIHESQHIRDNMKLVQIQQEGIPDLVDTAFWTIISAVLCHRKKYKTSKAALGIGILFLARSGYNPEISIREIYEIFAHIEKRAYEAEQTIDPGRWTNLVEFGPNKNSK